MEKLGIISDVHGDLPALKAVLEYLESQNCKEIIHTGDAVDIGPHSRECLELLLSSGVLCLLGNHDKDFVRNNAVHGPLSHVSAAHKRYTFDACHGYEAQVRAFPLFEERILGGKRVIFEHYCRLDPQPHHITPEMYLQNTFVPIENHPSAEKFDQMYCGYDCDAVFFGHKHEPCDFVGEKLYVDIGSVGCHPEPTANGIVIEYDQTHFSYRRFALPYDREKTRRDLCCGIVPSGSYLFDFYFLHKPDMPDIVE